MEKDSKLAFRRNVRETPFLNVMFSTDQFRGPGRRAGGRWGSFLFVSRPLYL